MATKARAKRTQETLSLPGFIRLYEAQLRAERKSPRTIEIYKANLIRFVSWYEGEFNAVPTLGDFERNNVRLCLADLAERPKWKGHPTLGGFTSTGVSTSTLHQVVRTLKTFGAWLEREEHLETHPLLTLKLPRIEEKQIVPLSEEEERVLVNSYDDNTPSGSRTRAIFLLMLDTGLRLSEVVSLKKLNVDLDSGFLLVMGKGRKERTIPFGFTCERALRKYVTFFRPTPAVPQVEEFFLSEEGYPMSVNALEMIVHRAAKKAGIKRLHAHLLRHTYGIRSQEQGVPTITLQHFMGHSSSKVTERYAHAAQSEKLKRARGYSTVDQLRVNVGKARVSRKTRGT